MAEDLDAAVGCRSGSSCCATSCCASITLGGDGDFTYESLLQRYESDLGNDLGNLLNRTVNMAHQYLGGRVDAMRSSGDAGISRAWGRMPRRRAITGETSRRPQALEQTGLCSKANRYIDAKKPWVLAKQLADDSGGERTSTMSWPSAARWLREVAHLIAPVMPETATKILPSWGSKPTRGWRDDEEAADFWPGATLGKAEPLFPRIDPDRKAALLTRWQGSAAPASTAASAPPSAAAIPATA